jgi:hypothetical protein
VPPDQGGITDLAVRWGSFSVFRMKLHFPGVLGRAHHPLEAHLLLCAVGQQGVEPKLRLFCILETV